ncbi:methyltransferase family protein [Tamaricihabitans halophyticus]|uniref:Methyltransferase family protein n=1 Tax=Tamaricihabitans halophyticus TaxID=1262583 RepID=A0A4V2SUY8_9PSEU|nr:class I SAM-dependent methyltransferase [Tamaricihabitans halophyticus]TCP56436.1 methyltransferase family protein [Tamaricihabitans halophyticus]
MSRHPQPSAREYERLYQQRRAPWNLGEPQPALRELVEAGWCTGTVLDAGCGVGELALAVAARGHHVLGVDLAPSAIRSASEQAVARGLSAHFRAADITELDTGGEVFDTVLDSGLLHSLPESVQSTYLAVLRRVCRIGGRIAVLCFADRPDARTPDSGRLSERRLRELFADGWAIDELVPAEIFGIIPDGVSESSTWPRDAKGRTPMTGWRLRARRVDDAQNRVT